MESNGSEGARGVNSHLLWSFMGTFFQNRWRFLHSSMKGSIWPRCGYRKAHREACGGTKRDAERGQAACSSAPHSRQSLVGRMGISFGLHFLKCWGNTLGQQGSWKSRRIQGTGGLAGLGSRCEAGRGLPVLGMRQEGSQERSSPQLNFNFGRALDQRTKKHKSCFLACLGQLIQTGNQKA